MDRNPHTLGIQAGHALPGWGFVELLDEDLLALLLTL
jgi:hypothetical protein